MDTLVAVLISWISVNFGLPESEVTPQVAFVPEVEMIETRLASATSAEQIHAIEVTNPRGRPDYGIYAIYSDETSTVYLQEDWSAQSPADVSILVHELVHHMQNQANLDYECPEMSEKLAYRAQRRWLHDFGINLESEFNLDPMTVLVRTNCWQ